MLAAPAAAAASGFRQFVVGPVAVGHGYSVVAFKDGCYAGPPNLLNPPPPDFGENGVELIKSIPGGTETHTYSSGRPATCDFTTGTFKLNLGRLATIDVTFHPHGSSWKGSLSSPCGESSQVVQAGTMTGTFKVDIDPSYLGSVDLHRTRGSIRTEAASPQSQSCHYTEMMGYFGPRAVYPLLDAASLPDGRSWVMIDTGRKVSRSVAGVRGVEAADDINLTGGPALFDPAPDLTSASVTGPGGPVTGQLRYSSKSRGGVYGTFFGSLRIAFDLTRTRTLEAAAGNAGRHYGAGPQLFEYPPG